MRQLLSIIFGRSEPEPVAPPMPSRSVDDIRREAIAKHLAYLCGPCLKPWILEI